MSLKKLENECTSCNEEYIVVYKEGKEVPVHCPFCSEPQNIEVSE